METTPKDVISASSANGNITSDVLNGNTDGDETVVVVSWLSSHCDSNDTTCDLNINISDDDIVKLKIVSFNMHGFNQGIHTVRNMVLSSNIDIFMLQEHWLTLSNLYKFNYCFPGYTCVLGYPWWALM